MAATGSMNSTAMVMMGIQHDHFADDAPIRSMLDDSDRIDTVKRRVLNAAAELARSGVTLIHVPIAFEPGHAEITQTVGILSVIKSLGLFELGSTGARPIPELDSLGDDLLTLSGRTGFNAFRGTNLDEVLSDRGVTRILLAGASTAACIDSTARIAYELGYEVVILHDCVVSRTHSEHELFCGTIFPQYATVLSVDEFIKPDEQ
jgi:nicotinamidase-related amidase